MNSFRQQPRSLNYGPSYSEFYMCYIEHHGIFARHPFNFVSRSVFGATLESWKPQGDLLETSSAAQPLPGTHRFLDDPLIAVHSIEPQTPGHRACPSCTRVVAIPSSAMANAAGTAVYSYSRTITHAGRRIVPSRESKTVSMSWVLPLL